MKKKFLILFLPRYYGQKSIFLESLFTGLFSIFLAIYFLQVSLSDLDIPFIYSGDGYFNILIIKSVLENGWYLFNDYLGAPFGSEFYDFPIPDGGMLVLIKIISYFSDNHGLIHNIIFLGSFFAVASVSYIVLRRFGVAKIFAFSGAITFTFIPFHFLRLPHLFYTWYFSVPIYVLICSKVMSDENENQLICWQDILLLIICASFGLYFAFFASVLLVFSAIYSLKLGKYFKIKQALFFIGVIYATLAVNLAPNILYKMSNEKNIEVADRHPAEAEIYGLRISQLVLPSAAHRIKFFSEKTENYNRSAPVVNENATATLGLVGTVGFFILLTSIFIRERTLSGIKLIPQLANLNLACFLLGTIGGLGTLFALFISPMIRGYNRISVFIAFLSITAFMVALQKAIDDKKFKIKSTYLIAGILILMIGILDQTSPTLIPNYAKIKQEYESDARFIQRVEESVSPGTMVYQLPYIEFPERGSLYQEGSYGLIRGYLHSKTLKWSYGAMEGRESDLWLKAMSLLPIEEQIQKIAASGFGGTYIDRRAFKDRAAELESQLKLLIPTEPIFSEDANLVFYSMQPTGNTPVVFPPSFILGEGFYGWEGGIGKSVWSSGDAELWLHNKSKKMVNIKLTFNLHTLSLRHVFINCSIDQKEMEFHLKSWEPQLANIYLNLQPGKNRLQFKTDIPAQLPGNGDTRKLAFNLSDMHIEKLP